MNDQDAERIRTAERRPPLACACCAGAASCPQLADGLWGEVWERYLRMHAEGLVHQRPLHCICSQRPSPDGRRPGVDHAYNCEVSRGRVRPLLCLECAERVIGRQLTLEDLESCVGNYAHFVMQTRAMKP